MYKSTVVLPAVFGHRPAAFASCLEGNMMFIFSNIELDLQKEKY